jgi:transcriptional regulator with XRE-family HTH domain
MTPLNDTSKTIHQGRNVKRFREMLGIKQETLAEQLGDGWSQKKLSVLEGKETIEPALLDELAKVLQVPSDAIKNFSEEAAFNIISNTYHDNSASVHYTFNPIEKVVQLYDALLKEKDEKIALLQRLLNKE